MEAPGASKVSQASVTNSRRIYSAEKQLKSETLEVKSSCPPKTIKERKEYGNKNIELWTAHLRFFSTPHTNNPSNMECSRGGPRETHEPLCIFNMEETAKISGWEETRQSIQVCSPICLVFALCSVFPHPTRAFLILY